MKIGFFDSGLGGVVVLNSVVNKMPEYDYEYFGDTKNLPYGDKSEDEIYDLTRKGAEYLFGKNCLIIIVACNSASASAVRKLQDNWLPEFYPDRKILGVIIPTIEYVCEQTPENILVIGTTYTIKSKKYQTELSRNGIENVFCLATPELVPLIEGMDFEGVMSFFHKKIKPKIIKNSIMNLVLACTHYGILKNRIREDTKCKVFSQDEIVADKLEKYFSKHTEIKNKLTTNNTVNYFFSARNNEYRDTVLNLLRVS